ncbi:MAG TPA: acyl-CoA dehydrogenase, partial [Burkholderiales bacterium]|nr:acyl-CoA dehydrogenase [Burkholderiales bacterium]
MFARGILLHGGNDALKLTLLPRLAAGKLIASVACCESTVEFDANALPATQAGTSESGIVLNGVKRFVSPATSVDGYIVSARDGGEHALFWVPASSAGLTLTIVPRADGTHSGALSLIDVQTDAAHRIGCGEQACLALAMAVDEAIVMTSAELFGVMDAALAITLDYMKTRVQFGKPIGSFQALQHRAVDLYIQKELALGAVDDAVRGLDRGVDAKRRSLLASRAKSRCADAALMITRDAIKLHGAIGFADECDIGLYLQRALVLSAWLGNGATHRRRYSRLTLDDAALTPSKTGASAVFKQPGAESARQSEPGRD